MPGKETSFNISLPTLILLLASFIGGAVGFGSMVSSLSDMKDRINIHDAKISEVDEKLNRLLGATEATQFQMRRLNDNIDKIK